RDEGHDLPLGRLGAGAGRPRPRHRAGRRGRRARGPAQGDAAGLTAAACGFATEPACGSPCPSKMRKAMSEIYVSTDVETDGPIPGPHSMLSFASAAYRADKALIATFSANLHTLPGAAGHPETMAWWQTQPEAWAAARSDLQVPEVALRAYVAWVKELPG